MYNKAKKGAVPFAFSYIAVTNNGYANTVADGCRRNIYIIEMRIIMKKKLLIYAGIFSLIALGGTVFLFTDYLGAEANKIPTQPETEMVNEANVNEANVNETNSKEDIHFRMLNSIDNFTHVKNKATIYYANLGTKTTIEAEVDFNLPASHVSYIDEDSDGNVTTMENYFNGSEKKYLMLYNEEKNFISGSDINPMTRSEEKKKFLSEYPTVESRYFEDDEGLPGVVHRSDITQMVQASDVIFPQGMALSYLKNYNLWDIVGKETVLNRDAVVIEGRFDDYFNKKYDATTFKFWVDSVTGIMLKYESYTELGEVRDYIYNEYIDIDQSVAFKDDLSVPVPPKGYTEIVPSSSEEK